MTPVPSPQAVAELAERLRKGGWAFVLHGDGREEHFWIYRSNADARLTCCKTFRRRGGATTMFSLDIEAGNVTFPGGIVAETGAALSSFPNIEAVAEFILTHDGALANEARP